MTRLTPHKLADHVRARASAQRVERQWAAIEQAGLPSALAPRTRTSFWLAGAAALGAVAAALVLLYPGAPASLPAGALVESAQRAVAVQLEDGSRVELAPESQLRLLDNRAQAVALELRSGKARFHVTRDRARRFQVDAGALQVRVVGTRFELTRTQQPGGTLVRVTVSEGTVEVRRRDVAGEVRRIGAGERWSALIADPRAPVAAEPTAEPVTAAAERTDDLDRQAQEAERATASALAAAQDEGAGLRTTTAPDGITPALRGGAMIDRDASAVFRKATLARRAGRMRDAAEAYAELLARHPGDARAGLSAFELGRIRMDALGDPAGAIQALERALAAGGASFHEDALARIVVASDALGRADACRAARARYLERYPDGVHAHALAARCR